MPRPTRRSRALIYVRGTAEEIDQQIDGITAAVERRGYEVAGVVREQPGSTVRWHEANQLVRDGEADLVFVASAANVPDILESATGALPGPLRPRSAAGAHRKGRRRRIRPTRREGGGA